MKQNYTFRRTLAALPLFLSLIFVASCGDDHSYTSNGNYGNGNGDVNSGARVWEYYRINEDGVSATVIEDTSDDPIDYDNGYDVVIPSTVKINGKEYRVTRIDEMAFYDYPITSIVIPNSVIQIGERACFGTSLKKVSIPESVTSIGVAAFSGNEYLTSITVASDNPVYNSRGGCNAIIHTSSNTLIAGCKNTTIPNNVVRIEDYAFFYSYYDEPNASIVIPQSVTYIGDSAFNGNSFTSVTCYAENPPTCYSYLINQGGGILYVPASALEKYKATYPWSYFERILPIQ